MFGGHLPWNDKFTLSLICNDEVLAVDQHSLRNRQLFRRDDLIAWVADVPDSQDKYLALFNARNPANRDGGSAQTPAAETATVSVTLAEAGIKGPAAIRDLWSHKDLGTFEKDFGRDLPVHGAGLYRVSPVSRVTSP